MAKWLPSYAASHEQGVHRISIATLKEWCGYASPMRKFREALGEALDELQRVGILESEQNAMPWYMNIQYRMSDLRSTMEPISRQFNIAGLPKLFHADARAGHSRCWWLPHKRHNLEKEDGNFFRYRPSVAQARAG
jgi:hypothetical protein